jgi:PAS domain S-box-containing protein
MGELWAALVGTGFMPHGHCYRWDPFVLWLHVGSDALIALAYYSIPASLARFSRQRPDLGVPWVAAAFIAFIFACGTTHVLAVWTVWQPAYGIEGVVKALTAAVSVATAIALVRILPGALALPSPATLEAANVALAAEVDRRRHAEERYRTLLESAPDGMVISDAAGRITFANAQTEALFGIPRGELVGQSIETLIPEALREAHVAHRTAFLHEPRLRPMGAGLSLHGRRRDGTEFPVEISLSPLRTPNETLVTAAIRDITARRRAEETVREYAVRLEALSRQLLTAQEWERRTIARELHDEVGQSLTALKLTLGNAREHGETAMLDDSVTLVEQLLQQVRELSLGLRPALLDDLGLAAALRWFVDRQGQRAHFAGHVETEGLDARLAPEVEIACFRVVQEAVTNVMRHARARHVVVRARRADGGIAISIRDDGVGMDVGQARQHALRGVSLGVLGMEDRVSLLGGRLEITSTLGTGTEVAAFIPIAADGAASSERAGQSSKRA